MSPQDRAIRTYKGAVAVVTGGASGIGRALSEALAQQGARVFVADLQAELAEQVAEGIRARGGEATSSALDVRDFAAFQALIQGVLQAHGRLDYLFNNAGIGIAGRAHLYRTENWDRAIDVNLRGVTNGVQAAYGAMLAQGFGHIVNTSSLAGLMPVPGFVSYCATKHAVYGLSTSLRAEAQASGVRVSVLCPGLIRTPALEWGPHHEAIEELDPNGQRRLIERMRPMDPALFAKHALRAIAANKPVIIIPARWRVVWWLNRLSPGLGLYLARKTFEQRVRALKTEAATPRRP